MNTNTIGEAIKFGNDVWYTIDTLSPQMFAVLGCIVAGIMLKLFWRLWPNVNKFWIPVLLIVFIGPVVYWKISYPDWESVMDMQYPTVKQIIIGHICGLAAWVIHQAILKDSWLEKKLFGNGETKPVVL